MKKINLLIAGLLSLSLNAQAASGGGSADTGGGNAVGNQLLDLFENEGTTTINVTQLKAYQQVLKPLFERIEQKIPRFTEYILGRSLNKTWLMDPKPLSKACINESMIDVARTPVACQTGLQVRIYETWYKKVDLKNQAALLLHEFFRTKAQHRGRSDEEVNYITRIVLAADNYTGNELINEIAKTGFGSLGSDSLILDVQVYFGTLYQANCVRKPQTRAVDFMINIIYDLSKRDFYGPRSDAAMIVRKRFEKIVFDELGKFEDGRDARSFKRICADLKNSDSLVEEAMANVNLGEAY